MFHFVVWLSCVVMHVKYIEREICVAFLFISRFVLLPSTQASVCDTLVDIVWKTSAVCDLSIVLSLHGIEPLSCSYWIAQVDSSASHHHQHHWCAKWNSPNGWMSKKHAHCTEYIGWFVVCTIQNMTAENAGQAGLYWNHAHSRHYSLLFEYISCWTIFCSACAHLFGSRSEEKKHIY